MSSIGTVEGYLKLTDDFTAVLDRAMGALGKSTSLMQTNLSQMNKALDMTGKAAKQMGAAAKKAGEDAEKGAKKAQASAGMLHDLRAAYAVAAIGIWQFIDRTVAAQQASDRMRNSLLAGTGDMKIVGQELAFVREESSRLGLDLATAGVQYGKLTAASKGTGIELSTVRATFTAVAEAATALGLSSEDTTGALNAVVQMMTKGTVQAEELRGQLGDRVPGAVQAMARALGVGNEEMMKMLEQGEVITAEVLPRFAEELAKIGGAGVEAGMQSFNAELNRLKTSLFDLFAGIASSSSLPDLVGSFRELVQVLDELVNSNGGSTFFAGLARDIANTIQSVKDLKQLLAGGNASSEMSLPGAAAATADFVNPAQRILDALHGAMNATEQDYANLMEEVRRGDTGALAAMLEMITGFRDRTREADEAMKNIKSQPGGPKLPDETQKIIANNAKVAKENTLLLEKMTKESVAFGKANSKAFDLEDKLQDQAKELEVFQKLLKENGGDFALAKKNAASYYAVLKAGLDPMQGWGKTLYDLARANDAVSESLADEEKYWKSLFAAADKTAKDLETKTAKSLAAVVERANKAIKQYQTMTDSMVEFRTEADRYWGSLDAASHGADALREFNKEAEIQDEILRRLGTRTSENAAAYDAYAAEIRDATGAMIDHRNWVEKTQAAFNDYANAVSSQDYGSPEANSAAQAIALMVTSMGQLRTATKLFSKESSAAWGGVINGALQLRQAIQDINEGTKGALGGKMSGDYSEAGSLVGGLIGSIWGPGGAALGSAIGGLVGSLIKTSAEKAVGFVRMNGNQIVATALGNGQGALGTVMGDLIVHTLSGFMDLVNTLGGQVASIPEIRMEISDDVITVIVDGYKSKFKDLDAAIAYGIQELAKSAEITGVDPMLLDILQSSIGGGMDEFKKNIEAGLKVMEFGMTNSQKTILAFTGELDGLSRRMVQLLGPTDQLSRALTNLGQEEIRRWQSSRDAITGDKMSNAEKLAMLKQDAVMWNAEKALRVAELTLKRDSLKADIELVKAGGTLNTSQTIAQANYLQTKADLYGYELTLGEKHLEGLAALDTAALAQMQIMLDATNLVIDALNNMPDIDVPHLTLPNTGGQSGPTGPSEAEQRAQAFNDFIESQLVAGMTSVEAALHDINKAFKEQEQAAIELGRTAELEAARIAAIARLRQEFLDQYATAGMSDYQAALFDLNKAFEEQAALSGDLAGGEAELAAARAAAMAQLREDLLDSFGTPMEALRDRIADFQQRMQDLAAANAELANQLKNGEISARDYANAIAHSDEVLNDFVMGLKSELLNLALYFTDAMGDTEASADIRRQLAILEWQYKKLELRMMIEAIRVAGGFGTAASNAITTMFAAITAGVNSVVAAAMPIIDPGNLGGLPGRPGSTPPGSGNTVGGGPGSGTIGGGTPPPVDPNNPGQWTYEQWIEWLNSLPDLPPMTDPNAGDNGNSDSGADPTDELLDRLLASIEDLRRTLETYQDFLASLERGPLSGATLQNQFNSAQSDFMEMLAAAQGGDMQAIRDLPGMAEEFLSIAAQYLDPASAEYQRILAMIQSSMGGIAGGLGDIINAAPESALGSNGVLDTIQEILAAMALRWGVDPGWNTGNLVAGGFDWHPNSPGTSDVGLAGSRDPSISGRNSALSTDRVVAILTAIDHKLGTGNELVGGQTNTLKREIGRLAEQKGQMGYAGPVRRVQR